MLIRYTVVIKKPFKEVYKEFRFKNKLHAKRFYNALVYGYEQTDVVVKLVEEKNGLLIDLSVGIHA